MNNLSLYCGGAESSVFQMNQSKSLKLDACSIVIHVLTTSDMHHDVYFTHIVLIMEIKKP